MVDCPLDRSNNQSHCCGSDDESQAASLLPRICAFLPSFKGSYIHIGYLVGPHIAKSLLGCGSVTDLRVIQGDCVSATTYCGNRLFAPQVFDAAQTKPRAAAQAGFDARVRSLIGGA